MPIYVQDSIFYVGHFWLGNPDLALVDPALTDNCPRRVSLHSGLDAITQVIEPDLSSRVMLWLR